MLPLRRLENDEDPEVRLAAERAIRKITQEDLMPGPIEACPQ
jgi:HEAT repeat protein